MQNPLHLSDFEIVDAADPKWQQQEHLAPVTTEGQICGVPKCTSRVESSKACKLLLAAEVINSALLLPSSTGLVSHTSQEPTSFRHKVLE